MRIAGHEAAPATQLCSRLHKEISLDEIGRIHIWSPPGTVLGRSRRRGNLFGFRYSIFPSGLGFAVVLRKPVTTGLARVKREEDEGAD